VKGRKTGEELLALANILEVRSGWIQDFAPKEPLKLRVVDAGEFQDAIEVVREHADLLALLSEMTEWVKEHRKDFFSSWGEYRNPERGLKNASMLARAEKLLEGKEFGGITERLHTAESLIREYESAEKTHENNLKGLERARRSWLDATKAKDE